MIKHLKEQYSIIPMYSVAAVWLMFGVTIGFGSITAYSCCIFISAFVFFLTNLRFPLLAEQSEQTEGGEVEKAAIDHDPTWEDLSVFVNAQYKELKDTPIAPFLNTIKESVRQIWKAIENDPERSKISYIRRFISLYNQYSHDLKDYESCCSISEPGRRVKELMESIEEKWKRIADVSVLLQDAVYSERSLSIRADAEVIKRIFAPVEEQQLSLMEGEHADEGLHN